MRIAFVDVTNWDYTVAAAYERPLGGSQSAICYLAEELARLGHEVWLLNGTQQVTIAHGVTCAPRSQVSRATWQSLDVVIIQNWARLAHELVPRVGPQTRLVLWTQHAHDQPAIRALGQPEFRDSHQAFVFVSDWQRQQYEQTFGITRGQSTVLRNAVAPAFAQIAAQRLATGMAPCQHSFPVLAYTSTPFRGLELLIDVFPEIRAAVPGARLKVFSSMQVYQLAAKADHARYGELYDRCRTTTGIEYVGSVAQPELARALEEVSVLAYPNTFAETSCIAVMEAMACGCHVVTSDLAALPETTAGFATLLATADWTTYRQRFVAATVAALRRAQQPHTQHKTIERQRRFIATQCTWAQRARQWQDWLANLCHRRPLNPPHARPTMLHAPAAPQTGRERHIRPTPAFTTG